MSVAELEGALKEGQTSLNNVPLLIDIAREDTIEGERARISLCKIFKRLGDTGRLKTGDTISAWLKERMNEYRQVLLDKPGPKSLELYMRSCDVNGFRKLLEYDFDLKTYLERYMDLRYYYYKYGKRDRIAEITTFGEETFFTEISQTAYRKAFTDAWLSVLRTDKSMLSIVPRIIPHMTQPTLLMDYLTSSYDRGGVNSILALNGLFYLIQHHNLDYPLFFEKLYALFNEDTMQVRYRSRFFRQADIFLSSTHISATLVASFIKRMSRLSLTAPPAAIVIIIPLVYNLLKRHPVLLSMIQRDATDDPFDATEQDPAKTKAIGSSLWELWTLTNHYHANVATLAKIFGEKLSKPAYALKDFLDHSYTTMTDAEMKKGLKKEVSVNAGSSFSSFQMSIT